MVTIIWVAGGALSFLLLLCLDFTAAVLSSRRRDAGARVFRLFLTLLLLALATLPALAFWAWGNEGSAGGALLFYLVFFGLLCYYLGRRMGREEGEARVRELMGIDSFDSAEEALDRLFESRLRLSSRVEVVKSIGVLAKQEEARKLEKERQSTEKETPAKADAAATREPLRDASAAENE